MRTYLQLAAAGFHRYSTYRMAIAAGVITQSVFGFIRVSVMFAAVAAAGGELAGYTKGMLSAYVWLGQGCSARSRCPAPPRSASGSGPATSRWT